MIINVIGVADALQTLRPNAEWSLYGDVIEWVDTTQIQPTDAEITAEISRLQAEYDAQEYARDRAAAYPSMEDQADMQFHDLINGTTTWQDAIQAVKDVHPKP